MIYTAAVRANDANDFTWISSLLLVADNRYEALGKAQLLAEELYPIDECYFNHTAVVECKACIDDSELEYLTECLNFEFDEPDEDLL